MRLIGYIRISDPSKQADGYSLQYQKERLVGWCRLYGHELVDVLEEGESGKSVSGRPVFKRVLQRVLKQHEADGLLCLKLDRFSRDEADAHLVKRAFDKAGKYIICTDEPINTAEPHGDVIFGLLVSLAAAEYKTLVKRFQNGRKQAQAQGRDLTSVPRYGYKKAGSGRTATIIEDEAEQEVLRKIEGYIAAGRSDVQIAARLNAADIKTRTDKSWSAALVGKIRRRLQIKIS